MNDKSHSHHFKSHGKIFDTILDTVGGTPLVRIPRFKAHLNLNADILLKLEFFNPLASVKDRIGVAMIEQLEKNGLLNQETTLIEPTSGNTGVALAFVAASRGYKIILTMPETMSIERRKLLKHLGATLVLTPASEGMKGAIKKAEELAQEIPHSIIPQQFENSANPKIHEQTTALEILSDTSNDFDVFVAGVGTGGTITGCGKVFKQEIPQVHIVAVEPSASPVLSGGSAGSHKIQGIGAGFVPAILDKTIIDEIITIDNDVAFDTSRLLARIEGIPAGISSGANLAAAIRIAQRQEFYDKRIVVIQPSFAERYISTALFEDA